MQLLWGKTTREEQIVRVLKEAESGVPVAEARPPGE